MGLASDLFNKRRNIRTSRVGRRVFPDLGVQCLENNDLFLFGWSAANAMQVASECPSGDYSE
jgi:hypothetical protein